MFFALTKLKNFFWIFFSVLTANTLLRCMYQYVKGEKKGLTKCVKEKEILKRNEIFAICNFLDLLCTFYILDCLSLLWFMLSVFPKAHFPYSIYLTGCSSKEKLGKCKNPLKLGKNRRIKDMFGLSDKNQLEFLQTKFKKSPYCLWL